MNKKSKNIKTKCVRAGPSKVLPERLIDYAPLNIANLDVFLFYTVLIIHQPTDGKPASLLFVLVREIRPIQRLKNTKATITCLNKLRQAFHLCTHACGSNTTQRIRIDIRKIERGYAAIALVLGTF